MITIPFSVVKVLLLRAPGDATLIEIVYRYLNSHVVTGQNPDIIQAELPRNMGGHNMTVGKPHFEGRVGQSLLNDALKFNDIILRQKNPSLFIWRLFVSDP